jgi:cold shock CspA family protein
MMQRMTGTGTVKWFNDHKGIGMITPEDGGGPIFIIEKGGQSYIEGQRVEFDMEPTRDGAFRATNIR